MRETSAISGAGFLLRHRLVDARGEKAHEIDLGTPVLLGPPHEIIFSNAAFAGHSGLFQLWQAGNYLIGSTSLPLAGSSTGEEVAGRIYTEMLRLLHPEQNLCRIWNYVPQINAPGRDGMEVYQSFCRGRSLAFEAAWGQGFKTRLPAGSAVGTSLDELVVIFAATVAPVQHFENPHQVPAYEYPCQYGPRPPSFARATVCRAGPAHRDAFVSGTSAVRGHRSVAGGATFMQAEYTLENLRDISRACHLGDDCGFARARSAHVKIYLRRPDDLPALEPLLRRAFRSPRLHLHVVQSDVCRENLNIEIEVTALGIRDDTQR